MLVERDWGSWAAPLTLGERAAAVDPRSAIGRAPTGTLPFMYAAPVPRGQGRPSRPRPSRRPSLLHHPPGREVALAQGDLARAERIAEDTTAGRGPDGAGLPVRAVRGAGLAARRRAAARVLKLDVDFYGADQGDRGNWGLVNAQLGNSRASAALARAYRRHGPARVPRRGIREAPNDGQQYALLGVSLRIPGTAGSRRSVRPSARVEVGADQRRTPTLAPIVQLQLARVQTWSGSKDKAVELLKPVFEVPNNMSRAWLRVDPSFVPLRKPLPGPRRWWGASGRHLISKARIRHSASRSWLSARERSRQPEPWEHAVLEAGHGADPVAGEGEDDRGRSPWRMPVGARR